MKKKNSMKRQPDSICWDCKKATGFCSWSREFKPVEGWEADKTLITGQGCDGRQIIVDSYCVHQCPLFVHD